MTPAERRAALADRLRNPPPDRVPWDFRRSCGCALHDIEELWPDDCDEAWGTCGTTAELLGLSEGAFHAVFGVAPSAAWALYGRPMEEVTAGDVADALEREAVADGD